MVHYKVSRRAILLIGSIKYTIGRHLGSSIRYKIESSNKGY